MANEIQTGDFAILKVGCYLINQAGINIYHYRAGLTSGTSATDTEAASIFMGQLRTLYRPLLGTDALFYGVSFQLVRAGVRLVPVVVSTNQGTGTGPSSSLPGQVSGIITKQTLISGRSARGRAYIPFPASDYNSPDTASPTDAYQTLLENLAEYLELAIDIDGDAGDVLMQPILRIEDGVVPGNVVVNCRANQKWATQRRRGNFGKLNAFPPF